MRTLRANGIRGNWATLLSAWNEDDSLDLGRLARRVPALVGLKTAGGDDAWYAAMREYLGSLSVFVPGHLLASGVARGASGAYSNVACLNPAAAQRWTDLMATDLPAALEVETRLRRFMSERIAPFITEHQYCNAACDRLMACIGGWADVGWRMRWPYRSIPPEEAARLRPVVRDMIPEFAADGVEAVPPREWGPERSGSQGGPGSTPDALSTGSGLEDGVEAVPPREGKPGRSATPALQLPKRKHPIHLPNRSRHNEPVIIFLTVCTANRRPILANAAMHSLLVKAWELSPEWTVGRYIVMPEHVHLFCSPARIEARGVNKWAAYWKSLISRGIQGYGPLASDGIADGVEAVPPFEGKPGRSGSPGGPGATPAVFGVHIWQRDGWDTQLRDGEHYHEKWEYVRRNPVRKELVRDPDEWPFQGELNVLLW